MDELTKLLPLLLYPLGVAFVLALVGLGLQICGRRRSGWVLTLAAVAWLWVWSMPVTSASHMRRTEAVFRAGGLEPIPVATDFRVGPDPVRRLWRYLPSVNGLAGSTAAVHEFVGYWFYWLRGWI